jgi:hypothetical protein
MTWAWSPFQAGRSWSFTYDGLDRLLTADNLAGTADDRSFAYDDADNIVCNSKFCAGVNPNLMARMPGLYKTRPPLTNSSGQRFGNGNSPPCPGESALKANVNPCSILQNYSMP